MPQHDAPALDTTQFGHAVSFLSPKKSGRPGMWSIRFDTGIFMFVPDRMFAQMTFSLREAD